MEAAEIARLAAARGIPVYCVKGVSDGPADLLPDFNPFISEDGQWEGLRFIAFALGRPKHWPALLRLANNSRKAARHLRDRLLEVLNP
jgi:adenosylhomocysteine nucleosidase